MSKHHSTAIYFKIFGALMFLTFITVWVSFYNLGALSAPVALLIAVVKATLVVLFFMHVLEANALLKLFVAGGFAWLLILFGITATDYVSRGWFPEKTPDSWIMKDATHFMAPEIKFPVHHKEKKHDSSHKNENHSSTNHH